MEFKLIAGLGNPGKEYANTYHNVGFLAIDYLLHHSEENETSAQLIQQKKFAYYALPNLLLVKPLTFMNKSGEAIKAALSQFHTTPEELLVIHDDADLPLGSYKIAKDRGAGGHHGIESIIEALGTNTFTRVRIGIRELKEEKRIPAEDIVLENISRANQEVLTRLFQEIFQEVLGGDAINVIVKEKP
jgi:PTH1 family peptidyl-tRNA hydrolase